MSSNKCLSEHSRVIGQCSNAELTTSETNSVESSVYSSKMMKSPDVLPTLSIAGGSVFAMLMTRVADLEDGSDIPWCH